MKNEKPIIQHSTFNIQHSLVCTVKNEADNIAMLLDSMLAQSCRPDEIVINDCGSDDATDAIVERYIAAGHGVRLVRGGFNIPSGRNNAIAHARGSIIACTDAGLILDPYWFERIIAPLEHGQADVVGGFFQPDARSLFEQALGATNYRSAEEIDPDSFLPFGQSVAFRKEAWEQVGGYPEWASHCEDLLFDMALKGAGYRFAFVPTALVHFRPRESLAAFARQYYLYARGDGVARLWTKRHVIRYITYLGGGVLALLAFKRPQLFLLHALGVLAYSRRPWMRLGMDERRATNDEQRVPSRRLKVRMYVPLIRLLGDLAKMVGYPVGIVRRLRSAELRQRVREYWGIADSR